MTIDPLVHIGHVHPKVTGFDRARRFCTGVLGLELQQARGDQAALVSAGVAFHHHVDPNTRESAAAGPANRCPDSRGECAAAAR